MKKNALIVSIVLLLAGLVVALDVTVDNVTLPVPGVVGDSAAPEYKIVSISPSEMTKGSDASIGISIQLGTAVESYSIDLMDGATKVANLSSGAALAAGAQTKTAVIVDITVAAKTYQVIMVVKVGGVEKKATPVDFVVKPAVPSGTETAAKSDEWILDDVLGEGGSVAVYACNSITECVSIIDKKLFGVFK